MFLTLLLNFVDDRSSSTSCRSRSASIRRRINTAVADHSLSFLGFLGLATPNFLLALILLYLANVWFGTSIGGLMDPQYVDEPWSLGKVAVGAGASVGAGDRHRHVGNGRHDPAAAGQPPRRTAEAVCDDGARQGAAGGQDPAASIRCGWRSTPSSPIIGNLLPQVVSGSVIVSAVMSLPTTGPMLLSSLRSQDMYLAGSFLMFLAVLTVVGMLVSDILLAVLDPRIRLTGGAAR